MPCATAELTPRNIGTWIANKNTTVPSISLEGLEKRLAGQEKELFIQFVRSMLEWLPEAAELQSSFSTIRGWYKGLPRRASPVATPRNPSQDCLSMKASVALTLQMRLALARGGNGGRICDSGSQTGLVGRRQRT
jgi:hypothetical protein